MKTKKRYGQHFLINTGIKEKIIASVKENIPEQANILEVGPGQGVLTQYLVKEPYNLKVAEIDLAMVEHIKEHIPELKEDQIVVGDIIKIPNDVFFGQDTYHLVGNFPYNISTQLLFLLFENFEQIPTMIGMFQKEVADRVVAPSGNKTYGILSVLLQAFYDCKRLFLVSRGSFNPPPKVDSAVILLRRHNKPLGCDKKMFKKVVKLAFSQRRKMLRNTLKPLIKEEGILQQEFFTKRPEHLDVEEFIELTKLIEAQI